MSGDVQVRKRKDKKKKRDSVDRKSEGELFSRKPSVEEDEDPKEHHGVHVTKMGTDDVHLHVQGDHETGGNWFAKIFFFSLLAILLGLIGLIIMENRGLSDLDTPLSESRFSNYFEGWVEEHRGAHDEHDVDKVVADHDGAFEEEDEHAEMEDEHELESEPDEEDEEEHEDDNADLENDGDEDEGDNEEDEEAELDKDNEGDENAEGEEDEDEGLEDTNEQFAEDEEEDEETNDDQDVADEDNKPNDEDDDDDEGFGDNEASNEVDNQPKQGINNHRAHDPFDEQTNKTFGVKNKPTNITVRSEKVHFKNSSKSAVVPQDDDFEDEDEPSVEIVENDAGEQLHLQQKKEQEAPQNEDGTNAEGSSSSIAVKIIVGVALAFVARLVLIRQNRSDNTSSINVEEKPSTPKDQPEMIPTEDDIPFDEDEEIVEEYEEEEEEEGGYFSKEERDKVRKFQPATFEELNAMYRPQALDNLSTERLTKKVVSQPYTPSNVVYHSDEQEKPNLSNVSKIESRDSHPSFDSTTKFAATRTFQPQVQRAQQQSSSSPPAQIKNSVTGIIPVEQEHSKPIFGAYSRDEPLERSKETQRAPQDSVEKDDNQPHSKELIDEEEYDEELIGEEEEEEDEDEDDAEISDVDDDDLMKRLEAKYGKLPETKYDSEEENVGSDEEDVEDPSWTKINSRGPQATYDGDSFLEEELRRANEEMLRNNFKTALSIYDSILLKNSLLPGALYGAAKALDSLAEKYKSNQMLTEAIQSFEKFINLGTVVDDETFVEAGERCIERMRFLGMHMRAVKIHNTLMKRFPNKPHFPNQLAVTYLLLNRLADAKHVLEDILKRWPNDGYAKVHYGFILKNLDKNLEKAVVFLKEGIETGENGTQDGRFYFNLGDALQRLGRREEAMEIYKKGAEMKLFLSKYQRSLYNVDHLKAQPYWTKDDTTYTKYFDILEKNFEKIKEEGLNALNTKGYFVDEAESLRDVGDWKQFELFARGYRNTKNCQKAPFTCKSIESFPAARNCKRGQVKFSVMHPGTHVWPHCGPTNCRLRAHLGLKVPPNTVIRVAEEKRSWEEGKFLIFDDSFEHEVWHNGTTLRLVLIIDVWHPELSQKEREELSPI